MTTRTLIVGAGFFGSVCAYELQRAGHEVLVLEKRNHIGGNCYTEYSEQAGCHKHVYGAHIFHTDNRKIWNYVKKFSTFNTYINRPKVNYRGSIYSFPINLFTFYQICGAKTPAEAREYLDSVCLKIDKPANLEEWCLSRVGPELYTIFIEGYTKKQWQKHPRELPVEIIQRIPVRLNYNDNYFNHRYQGIPTNGYTAIFERLLENVEVCLNTDFLEDKKYWLDKFDHVIYTGPIDSFFGFESGVLEYRSLQFKSKIHSTNDYQGNAVINYTDKDIAYTRTIEHKHFDLNLDKPKTIVTTEYPQKWHKNAEPFYPVVTEKNLKILGKYKTSAEKSFGNISFGGRLGEFKYYDMDQVVSSALRLVKELTQKFPVE